MTALPDPLPPHTQRSLPVLSSGPLRATLISTFKADEPIEKVIRAVLCTALPYTLAITGKRSGAGELLRYEGEKIRFTDFLPQEEYEALLRGSDLIIDLTTHQNCLVCGAYEGLSLGIPLLLSDSPASREYFPLGCLYTDNTVQGVQCALERFFEHRLQLSQEILCLYPLLQTRWEALFNEVTTRILHLEGRECERQTYQAKQLVESASHHTHPH
jgi:glycosyltransferase involved in cell wall biosynthesis